MVDSLIRAGETLAHISIFIIFMYILLGAFAGTMSGMLGIGGGVIVVPGLAWLFGLQHFPHNLIMHMAAGTSLAVMIGTTLRALYAHRRHKTKFWHIYRRLLPGVIIGVILGAILAHYLHSYVIALIFATFILLISLHMLFGTQVNPRRNLPGSVGMWGAGLVVGGKSGLLGVGGGSVMVPFLLFCNVEMRTAMVVSIATSLTVAMVGTVAVGLTGMYAQGLPAWSLGYIYWPAWIAVVVGSILFAPLGAALSYRISVPLLRRIFAVFLLLVSLHLFIG